MNVWCSCWSPSGVLLLIVLVQLSLSSCFLATAAIMLSVIHGLFKGVRLVTFGFSSLHERSKALLKRSVKSEKLFETTGPRLPRLLSSIAMSLSRFSFEKS